MQSKPHPLPPDEAEDRGVWRPQPGRFTSDELMEAMVDAACAGPACSHDRPNVLWKIDRLVSGDPDAQFGLTGLNSFTPTAVLGMVAIEAELPADHLEVVPGGAGLDEQDRGIAGDPHEEKYGHRQEEQREERVANTSQDVSFHDYFFSRRSS